MSSIALTTPKYYNEASVISIGVSHMSDYLSLRGHLRFLDYHKIAGLCQKLLEKLLDFYTINFLTAM